MRVACFLVALLIGAAAALVVNSLAVDWDGLTRDVPAIEMLMAE